MLTNKDGTKAISAKDKAKTLNDFFTSVFTTENLGNIPAVKNAPAYEVLSNIEITPYLVRTKLNALNLNKSPGKDKWHPYFRKELSETMCTPLSILFTKSLKEGAHESWRKAVIMAIYKKRDEKFNGELSTDKYQNLWNPFLEIQSWPI